MNRKERREKRKEIDVLNELIQIINQYFPELISRFDVLTDLGTMVPVLFVPFSKKCI